MGCQLGVGKLLVHAGCWLVVSGLSVKLLVHVGCC